MEALEDRGAWELFLCMGPLSPALRRQHQEMGDPAAWPPKSLGEQNPPPPAHVWNQNQTGCFQPMGSGLSVVPARATPLARRAWSPREDEQGRVTRSLADLWADMSEEGDPTSHLLGLVAFRDRE